jgi:hypothetical protein
MDLTVHITGRTIYRYNRQLLSHLDLVGVLSGGPHYQSQDIHNASRPGQAQRWTPTPSYPFTLVKAVCEAVALTRQRWSDYAPPSKHLVLFLRQV